MDIVEHLRDLKLHAAADEIEKLRREIAIMTHGIELENEKLREQLAAYKRDVAALMQVNANLRKDIHLMARALAGDKIEGIEDLWKSLSQEEK